MHLAAKSQTHGSDFWLSFLRQKIFSIYLIKKFISLFSSALWSTELDISSSHVAVKEECSVELKYGCPGPSIDSEPEDAERDVWREAM